MSTSRFHWIVDNAASDSPVFRLTIDNNDSAVDWLVRATNTLPRRSPFPLLPLSHLPTSLSTFALLMEVRPRRVHRATSNTLLLFVGPHSLDSATETAFTAGGGGNVVPILILTLGAIVHRLGIPVSHFTALLPRTHLQAALPPRAESRSPHEFADRPLVSTFPLFTQLLIIVIH